MNRVVFSTRTLKFRYSFFPDTLISWNNLSSFIKSAPTLNIFKKCYMVYFNFTPNPEDPIGLKYLTRLRVAITLKILSLIYAYVKMSRKLLNITYCTAYFSHP